HPATMDPNQTNPEELMTHFRGRSFKSIVIFTVVLHVVIIGGSSIPWLMRTLTGQDTSKLSEDERMQLAVKEATSSLRKIAETHGLQAQQLGDRLKGASAPAAPPEEAQPEAPQPETPPTTTPQPGTTPETPAPNPAPDRPKSEVEKQIEKVAPGPTKPPLDPAEDLFKDK
ncbi:MAG TPA: hypothetical protein VFY13_04460, partial [Luteolibacter sp.]|nr:hypothetical protein [Luteolibacter sp.]